MFLISSSPSAARLSNSTAAAAATTYQIPMTASCGIWLVRLPVTEKIAAPVNVKARRDYKSRPAFQVDAKKNGDTNSERSHLRHGDVDENNSALNDVQPKIDQQPWQENAGHNRPKHYFPHNYGRDGSPSRPCLFSITRRARRSRPTNKCIFISAPPRGGKQACRSTSHSCPCRADHRGIVKTPQLWRQSHLPLSQRFAGHETARQ